MAPLAHITHTKKRRRVIVLGCLVFVLSLTVLAYRSGAVVCTPLGSVTTVLSLCKPQGGETNWATAINNNFDILDSLFNAGTQTLKGIYGGVPQGAILLIDSGICPAGFTEVTAMRGFYPRAMLAAGETIGTTVGTALTALENRAVGQHTHTITRVWGGSFGGGAPAINADLSSSACAPSCSSSSEGLISAASAGSVAGTNAPYYLVRFCKKT